MSTVAIHAAKTSLSKPLARVEAGGEIVIARGKTPIARLTPIRRSLPARRFGAPKGIVSVGPEFFDLLPDDEFGDRSNGQHHPPPVVRRRPGVGDRGKRTDGGLDGNLALRRARQQR